MKLQRRTLRVRRQRWIVLTPRPGARAAFSTNRFHETWHVVSDARGARLLARLLWGLAYQRRPRTVILLGGDLLRPTPFDADPSDPIVLANTALGVPGADVLRAMRLRLPTGSAGAVRWQTWGLDQPVDWEREFPWWDHGRREAGESIARLGGCLRYAARPDALRLTARQAQCLDTPHTAPGGNYRYLVDGRGWPEGELQTFGDYRQRDAVAPSARRAVLETGAPTEPQRLREAVWRAAGAVARRRRGSYRRRARAGSATMEV